MNQNEMIQSLRAEITKLQRILDLLLDSSSSTDEIRRPSRPKGSGTKATSFNPEEFASKKRTMSAEGKARIAAAQKRRWAAQKNESPDPVVRKQVASTKKTGNAVPTNSALKVASTARKSAGAGKRTGATQKRTTTGATKKTAQKKTAVKKTSKSATKRPAKQVNPAGPEPQTTA